MSSGATARVLLIKAAASSRYAFRSSTAAHCSGSLLRITAATATTTNATRTTPILSPLHVVQRRHYLYLPSDWGEFQHRWNLFWEKHGRTKVKLRIQERYKLEKSKIKDKYNNKKSQMKDKYLTNKDKMKDQYELNKDKMKDRYQEEKSKMKDRYQVQKDKFQERRGEFSKRWTARRKDIFRDSASYMKGYMYRHRMRTKVFTIDEYCQPEWFDPHDGRPLASLDPTGRFVNPWLSWSSNGVHKASDILKWRYQRTVKQWQERGFWSLLPKDLPQMLFGPSIAKDKKALEQPRHFMNGKANAPAYHVSSDILAENHGPENKHTNSPTDIDFTWIGHNTCLVKMGNATLLTDPIFSRRCSPFQRLPGIGVARDVPPSLTIEELPHIDVCMISHDHYDHMDQQTIINLRDRVDHWVVPKGIPEWLETRCSVDLNKVIELEWWEPAHWTQQSSMVQTEDSNFSSTPKNWELIRDSDVHDSIVQNNANNGNLNTLTITCTPAQHWSSRTFFDRCKRLWCSFAVETRTHASLEDNRPVVQKFFFAGDTGMPRNGFPLFEQIGDYCGHGRYHSATTRKIRSDDELDDVGQNDRSIRRPSSFSDATSLARLSLDDNEGSPRFAAFHPFDLAALPIGAYEPAYLMQDAHMNPIEAVQCARQLQARKSVAIHWGTFALSEEPIEEPPQKLHEMLSGPENDDIDFVALPIGGSLRVPPAVLEENEEGEDVDDEGMMEGPDTEADMPELGQTLESVK